MPVSELHVLSDGLVTLQKPEHYHALKVYVKILVWVHLDLKYQS